MNAERRIWIVSEGSPGHVTQSLGLCTGIGGLVPVTVSVLETKPVFGGFGRQLVRRILMGNRGRRLPDWFLGRLLGVEFGKFPDKNPEVIVSSGGKSVFAARSLARKFQVPFIFIGERKPYPPDWFDLVFSPSVADTAACDVRIDLIPTKIDANFVKHAAEKWEARPEGRVWAMLLGGSSRSHHFEMEEWETLGREMGAVAQREGIRWLLSTSRRTGREVEKALKKSVDSSCVADATWWCHDPKKLMAEYLGAADLIFVTQDSISMVTEAVASGKPVVVIYPSRTSIPHRSFMLGYFENLEKKGAIVRMPMSDFSTVRDFPQSHERGNLDGVDEMGGKAVTFLGWENEGKGIL